MAKSNPALDAGGVPAGMVRLHHDSASACSHGGCLYETDSNGDVVVPTEAAETLSAHGFLVAPIRRPVQSAED